ncbi:MAG: isoaspartyl peptidase/L-asparaginase [Bacteroidales bacterium]|nr:isoaspartyl peptidase/L-asparaginase [Bacteroidales bacterium]MCF8457469.1 isoaspartyl peptidase/L-asparaginase [Bacteroidales bacterium]
MRNPIKLFWFAIFVLLIFSTCQNKAEQPRPGYALVIHGGSGNFSVDDISIEKQKAYREKMKEALLAGEEILKENGSCLDAVEACIRIMEDSPLFNAGKGSVFTHEGTNEMDASIMVGSDRKAGAVAGVKHVKNPISAARAVMEKSKHVMLSGSGADFFASENGLDTVGTEYFYTEERWQSLQNFLQNEKKKELDKLGTVGCVALDKMGNLAAGTSTGGMTNKMFGRIGDSPIVGCGSYADNNTCGISFTGHGEYIIRTVAAHDIAATMGYKNVDLKTAMTDVIMIKLKSIGGDAGAIGIDKNGDIEMVFNTKGMFRGYVKPESAPVIFIGE